MEQTLISKKNLAEVYKKWIQDCASEDMKTECGVIEDCLCELYAQEVIDPLHALGACYCRECKHYVEIYEEQGEGICGRECLFEQPHVRITGFCSYGERKQNDSAIYCG